MDDRRAVKALRGRIGSQDSCPAIRDDQDVVEAGIGAAIEPDGAAGQACCLHFAARMMVNSAVGRHFAPRSPL